MIILHDFRSKLNLQTPPLALSLFNHRQAWEASVCRQIHSPHICEEIKLTLRLASIMRSVEQSNQLMGNTLEAAFSDLNALMAKAADMVNTNARSRAARLEF